MEWTHRGSSIIAQHRSLQPWLKLLRFHPPPSYCTQHTHKHPHQQQQQEEEEEKTKPLIVAVPVSALC